MTKHLIYDLWTADNMGVNGHPLDIMAGLGITYQHATPQSISDSWWFWNCENIPDLLPDYLELLDIDDPTKYVGWGLDLETAERIKNYK